MIYEYGIHSYNSENGMIKNINTGKELKSMSKNGYLNMRFGDKTLYQHHFAWLAVNNYLPDEIDHINGIRNDNRIINLREVTRHENMKNKGKSKNNKSGITGVYLCNRDRKWRAEIMINYKKISLGSYDNIYEAAIVRKLSEILLDFGENHGK